MEFTKEDLEAHIKQLVANLANIHNPDEFHPVMSFRGIPKVIINIYDGMFNGDEIIEQQSVSITVDNKHAQFLLNFGAHPRSAITKEHVSKFLDNGQDLVKEIVNMLWPYYSRK